MEARANEPVQRWWGACRVLFLLYPIHDQSTPAATASRTLHLAHRDGAEAVAVETTQNTTVVLLGDEAYSDLTETSCTRDPWSPVSPDNRLVRDKTTTDLGPLSTQHFTQDDMRIAPHAPVE